MKKRTDIVIFIVCIGLAAVLSAVYAMERTRAIGKIRQDLETLHGQQPSRPPAAAPESLVRMFPRQPELSLFVDGLYQYAGKSGVRNLEVQTLPLREKIVRTGGRKDQKAAAMRSYPVRIMLEGSYRAIAEYIRLVQNSERFTRVLEFDIQPGKDLHRATMNLEIFSIEAPDAS